MRQPHRQRGFSLVELMIAMLIGLFLVSGLVYVYIGSKTNYNHNEGMSRLQENGRFAIGFLTSGIRGAGFTSCAENVGYTKNTLNPVASDFLWDFDTPLEGYNNVGATWPADLDGTITGQSPVSGTDIIVVRSVGNQELTVTDHPGGNPPGSADIKVVDNTILRVDDVVIVTDCKDAAIFQVTNINTTQGFNLVHNEGAGNPGNWTKDLGKNYDVNGKVLKMETEVYYLAASNFTPLISLWRKVNNNTAEELVSGVEDMQILYGEDTNADRMADVYVAANAVGNMDNVVSVRIALLLTTIEQVAPQPVPYSFTVFTDSAPNDRRLHREFLATINLRNRTP